MPKTMQIMAFRYTQNKGRGDKYLWTRHSREKMRHYRLSESRIKRIIRHPARVEEGILEGAIACMQPAFAEAPVGKPASGKKYSEIWAMYVLARSKIKIITAWRYPGKSPARDPVPHKILEEAKCLIS